MKLIIEQLSYSYRPDEPILRNNTLEIDSGGVTVLIGANAAGKSTFLKCIANFLKYQGNITLDGKNTRDMTSQERTEKISYLPQDTSFKTLLTVFEAVLLGNLQSLSWRVTDNDLITARNIMEELNIFDIAHSYLTELSGGQKQLVSIAQAVIRNPQVLLLDEPTNNLDLHHQLEIMEFIKRINNKNQISIVALHDLNLAIKYADNLIVFKNGTVYASGKPEDVITAEMIRDVYGVHAIVKEENGLPYVLPTHSASIKIREDNFHSGIRKKGYVKG